MNSTVNIGFPLREPKSVQELTDLVQNTITQIQEKFGQMSDSILTKVDDMGRRIDELERNVAHIVSLSNAESSSTTAIDFIRMNQK